MSFVSTLFGNHCVNGKQAQARQAALVGAVEALEGRQLLSAILPPTVSMFQWINGLAS